MELTLNVFDAEGNVVNSVRKTLSADQIQDIIDHAAQSTVMIRRVGAVNMTAPDVRAAKAEFVASMAELDEALTVADVIMAKKVQKSVERSTKYAIFGL